jgi:hypothetical protein
VQLATFLAAQRLPDEVRDLRREHIEVWMIELLGRWKPATVNNRYRGLQAFFRWCLDEDIIAVSPMAKMKPPRVPEQPVPVLRLEAVAKLIATAERTKAFEDVRDVAILRIFYRPASAWPSSPTSAARPTIPRRTMSTSTSRSCASSARAAASASSTWVPARPRRSIAISACGGPTTRPMARGCG